ncbi:MAG TPA: OmpA family protein [Blastocatellia bacterium]|nr:OmpA family protein [Blastocatellia bacterium]
MAAAKAQAKDKTPPRRRKNFVKRRSHGAHHGGAWKVAYADFVTAMMALFLVLWLVTQNNKIKESVAHYFRNMGISKSGRDVSVLQGGSGIMKDQSVGTGGKNADKGLASLKVSLRERFEQKKEFENIRDQIHIEMVSEGLRIHIIDKADQVLFDVGSAQLKPETVKVLKAIGDDLKALSNTIVIEGYTDSHQYENPHHYGNWELSTERALNARRVLTDSGVRDSQIVRVTGHADKALFNQNDPYDPTNRRISITVLFQQEKGQQQAEGKESPKS